MSLTAISRIICPATTTTSAIQQITGWLGLAALVSAVVLLTMIEPASACDEADPIVLSTDHATVEVDGLEARPEQLREWTEWMARLEALLPAGFSVKATYYGSEVTLCEGEEAPKCRVISEAYDGVSPKQVFARVASALRAPAKGVAWLEARRFRPLTVQVGSTPHYGGAEHLAGSIDNETGAVRVSQHGSALVLTEEAPDGSWRFRIVTGLYLSLSDAEDGLARVEGSGHSGFIRRL